jgi:5'(3')-deoxyribonucleotidase
MKKSVIAVDIDDVLADSAQDFIDWSNKKYNTKLTIEDYHEHWAKIWQVDNDETERRAIEYHCSGSLMKYKHNPYARKVLEKLRKNFKLIIVTSRPAHMKEDTRTWIHNFYPNLFSDIDISFAGMWDRINDNSRKCTKGELSRELGADYIIDDQIKHCKAAAKFGIKALLFGDYSWNLTGNKLPRGITRVKDWNEVERYFNTERANI